MTVTRTNLSLILLRCRRIIKWIGLRKWTLVYLSNNLPGMNPGMVLICDGREADNSPVIQDE